MGYRVIINGIEIFCDTADDALALTKSQERVGRVRKERSGKRAVRGTRTSLGHNGVLKGKAHEFLVVLRKAYPKGVPTHDLARQLGIDTKALPPLSTAVKRYTEKAGLKLRDVVTRKVVFKDRKPVSVYYFMQGGMVLLEENWESV